MGRQPAHMDSNTRGVHKVVVTGNSRPACMHVGAVASAWKCACWIGCRCNELTTLPIAGANGYVAGELVHQLLQKGYDVHGTVRDPGNPAKTAHLYALAAALPGTLKLHSADLLQDGSFDEVIR